MQTTVTPTFLRRPLRVVALAALLVVTLLPASAAVGADDPADGRPEPATTFTNPLHAEIPGEDAVVENCPDPTILSAHDHGDPHWYAYCTTDPLHDDDRDEDGDLRFRLIPMLRSADLVSWTYVGDAFDERADWVGDTAGLWAPEVVPWGDEFRLYYTAQNTQPELGGNSAIGVATGPTPTGPWTDIGAPIVAPEADRSVLDPDVIEHEGTHYIYFGGYHGGVFVRELSADGLSADPATESQVTVADRFEGPYLVERDGYWYMFLSATNCCTGPLTGYTVYAGRSVDPRGPFVDADGVSLMDARAGGTFVINMTGNRWVGPGHNAVFTDFDGQDWFLYHAIDREAPYYAGEVGFTKRPLMMDALDWVDGWPTVRNGNWVSDDPQPAPAAQPGDQTAYAPEPAPRPHLPGERIDAASDDFSEPELDAAWEWVREPADGDHDLADGRFTMATQAADLHQDNNTASVLTRDLPDDDYIVDTRVWLDLPADGCCFNHVQAGLVVYGDDDHYLKLVHVAIGESRQTEFAKEWLPDVEGTHRYGNTVVGTPGDWTDLRIAKQDVDGEEHYTAYTRIEGQDWVRGGTWTHELGSDVRIGLVAMGGEGYTAEFEHLTVSTVRDANLQRIAGTGRIETAIATSQDRFATAGDDADDRVTADAIVLARADEFPDALAATPLAARANAPVLLTTSDGLVDAVADEITRVLGTAGVVHLVGGTVALDQTVEAAVAALGHDVVRHSGETRFETAGAVAAALGAVDQVLITTGLDHPDALTAGAAAAAGNGAVLLTGGDDTHAVVDAYLADFDGAVWAVGGPAARAYPQATSLVGATREGTAVAVADALFDDSAVVGIAVRDGYPDALAGGAHIAHLGGPLVLTHTDHVPDETAAWLVDQPLDDGFVYGSTGAIDAATFAALERLALDERP